jgi:hypothetical protein
VNRDFIDELERELRAASQRRVRLAAAQLPRPSAGTAVSGLRAIPGVVAVLVVIAVAAVALFGIQHRPPGHSAATPAVSGREQLIGILGVLRRAQTPADLHSPGITRLLSRQGSGADVALIRRAATTPWGDGVFVIPIKPAASQLRSGERIDLEAGSGGACCAPAADIQAGHDMVSQGAGRSFAGGSTGARLVLLVPDGVAKVQFLLPRQPSRNSPGSPIYAKALRVIVPVHGNIAAVQVKRECCAGAVPMIWYGPGGQVIKRIGNPATVNRVLAPAKPGPQTAQSRAAQRDPSTPNRVWVTPATGNQHAKYAVHFRLLLNDADYHFEMSGTSCPQITVAGGGGGGGGDGDLRGRILSYDLDAVTGQTWCPGTYRISVRVMDLGRFGNLKHPAHPFGSATFTVRP